MRNLQIPTASEHESQHYLNSFSEWVTNVFCPTGQGGGVDPTCSPKGGGGGGDISRHAIDYISALEEKKAIGDARKKTYKDAQARATAAHKKLQSEYPSDEDRVLQIRAARDHLSGKPVVPLSKPQSKPQSEVKRPNTKPSTQPAKTTATSPEVETPQRPKSENRTAKDMTSDLSENFKVGVRIDKAVSEERAKVVLEKTESVLEDMADWEVDAVRANVGNRQLTVSVEDGKSVINPEHGGRAAATYNRVDAEIRVASKLPARNLTKPKVGKRPKWAETIDTTVSGGDLRTTISHEFGHAVTQSISVRAKSAGVSLTGKSLYDSKPKSYWKSTVSPYAAKNYRELMAEAYAAWKHPGYSKGKQLPPELVEVFTKAGVPQSKRKS